jgi:hypothetical protein
MIFGSCYQEIEGCLDADATNYNPEADEDCCCTYPVLKLDVLYTYDTVEFILNETFHHTIHDSFKLLEFGILLHDFNLGTNSGSIPIGDLNEFYVKEGADSTKKAFRDDFVVLRNKFNYDVGLLAVSDHYSSLMMNVGLTNEKNDILPSVLSSGHALKYLEDEGYWNLVDGYKTAFIEVLYGPNLADTLIWSSNHLDFQGQINVALDTIKVRGEDLTLGIDLDMKNWLGEVDFTSANQALTDQLRERLESAIKIR